MRLLYVVDIFLFISMHNLGHTTLHIKMQLYAIKSSGQDQISGWFLIMSCFKLLFFHTVISLNWNLWSILRSIKRLQAYFLFFRKNQPKQSSLQNQNNIMQSISRIIIRSWSGYVNGLNYGFLSVCCIVNGVQLSIYSNNVTWEKGCYPNGAPKSF